MNYSLWRSLKISFVIITLLLLMGPWPDFSRAAGEAPILLVVNNGGTNPFGSYLAEILRAEGLNNFDVVNLSALSATDLNSHDLTILAETTLSAAQDTLLTNYVNGNGRLLAMRPDSDINDLFGLGSSGGAALTTAYLKINTATSLNGTAPGQGLSSETLQIHGEADRYTPAGGATVLAQLYSNATTATSFPAVIAGSSGRAVAFTYDLARNVVYTRQGNPANANVDTDGDTILRTIDLFQTSGGGAPWVNLDRIQIPQADVQQRLFARLVKQMVAEVRPLPQLWYFPSTAKTILILTGDAHGNPEAAFENELSSITAHGGKITLYLTIGGEFSDNDMDDWLALGHDFGIHPYAFREDPFEDYDVDNLIEGYDKFRDWWDSEYSVDPSPTVRHHQLAWLGWTDAAEIAESRGYALDTNFYHWGPWLEKQNGDWAHGYVTGSGQPMKFIRTDGAIVDVYQQLTQLVDEQMVTGIHEDLNGAEAIDVSEELIDASQAGDYAAIMTQMHVDYYDFGDPQVWTEGMLDYANGLNIPVWNAAQWLEFTQMRHDAEYGNIVWDSPTKTLSFDLTAATMSGVNLSTMVPLNYQGNPLGSVKVDNVATAFTTQTINGVSVAFVSVPAGSHSFQAIYQGGPTPNLSINDVTVTEDSASPTQAVFNVTMSPVSTQTVTVNYATANGTAIAPADYTAISGTLTFNPGVSTRPVTVTLQTDTLDEDSETFVVNLASASGAIIGDSQGQGSITDNDDPPNMTINDVSLAEGTGGVSNAVFTVSLSAASGKTVSVNYTTANSTATAPSDYTAISGTLTFTAGVITRPITVSLQTDAVNESSETFLVNLSSAVGANLTDSQGIGTILNDDATFNLSINDVSMPEGTGGSSNAVFTVTLSPVSTQTVSVNYATANGTATAPSDYTAISGTLSFAPGVATQPITVTLQPDALDEDTETFLVNLTSPISATISDGQGQATLTNDDTQPEMSINDTSVTEGQSGTTNAVFIVSLTATSGKTITVNYGTANGSATAPADYGTTTGSLTFNPGVLTRTITVPVVGENAAIEPSETFLVNLSGVVGATLTDAQGQGTILDDDSSFDLSINDVIITEGNSGAPQAIFTVSLSAASGQSISVNYATANGTATAPADYTAISGTLTFAPGVITRPITVTIKPDSTYEAVEIFLVNLTSPSGANLSVGNSQGEGTILDDDAPPSLSISDGSVNEGHSGTVQAIFSVTLSSASGQAVSVNYATANSTATAPDDYTAISGTLTFAPGVVAQPITVTVKGDMLDEADEIFLVNMVSPSGATINDSQAEGTILNDDSETFPPSTNIFLPLILK